MTTATKKAPEAAEAPAMNLPAEYFSLMMTPVRAWNWQADQMEALGTAWVQQARTMRHDGLKVLEAMVAQSQGQMEEAVKRSQEMAKSVPGWDAFTMEGLRRRVEEAQAAKA